VEVGAIEWQRRYAGNGLALNAYRAIIDRIRAARELTEGDIISLAVIVKRTMLAEALQLIDNKQVVRCTSQPSNRVYYRVKGKSEMQYICVANFCSCPYFVYNAVSKEAVCCKHLLAVEIASALDACIEDEVEDHMYAVEVGLATTVVQAKPEKQREE